MELNQTVDLMLSDDYKDRLKAEYYQLFIRLNKLDRFIEDEDEKGNSSAAWLLEKQRSSMCDYLYILKLRLKELNVNLD